MGVGSDCSMKCAVYAAVCHGSLVRTRCELDAVSHQCKKPVSCCKLISR